MTTWTAPGRLNLIGEHTDYNDGFVLPLALPFATTATVTARSDGLVTMRSVQRGEASVRVADLAPGAEESWSSYVAGVVWAFGQAGHDVGGGFDVVVDGRVPVGAGLSSSAALECSVAAALDDLLGAGMAPKDLALLAQRVENDYVGIPSGMMDQMAAMLCTAANALFLDCRSLEAEQVPLDVAAAGLVVLGMDSRAPHQLTDGAYGERRRDCEAAAATLGVPALRDATEADLDRLEGVQLKRARHVVTEDARVLATVAALRDGRVEDVGPLLSASHASMRDDFEITVPRVDLLAAAAEEAGALGARMTGGGFGGCVLALVPVDREAAVRDAVVAAYTGAGFGEPGFFAATPSDGARKVD
ncbi:MAG TPA: galactokinase [Mycobacteriales bacterium]|nr:galactokinase [Mycobacteriales bacterium]